MNLQAKHSRLTEADPEHPARAGSEKFTYASGSRPLDGYTIKRGVGRGGFGEVYYATSDGGKEVALKLVRRNLDVELRGATQCLNLKHPNLLGLYDIRKDETDHSWIVMEYVAGSSLEEAIENNASGMPIDQVLFWFHGMAAGIAYLHDHGIVHRDLKPGNIFSDEGLVKVGDYGLSKFISVSRRSGQTESVGTVHYMAPEVGKGRYGKEIDIYALGIMLYEMLTGHVPFDGESVGEILMKHLTDEPDLSKLQEPYRTAVGRALTKDPEKRIRMIAEFLELLPEPAKGHFIPMPHPAPAAIHAVESSESSDSSQSSIQAESPSDAAQAVASIDLTYDYEDEVAGVFENSIESTASSEVESATGKTEEPILKLVRDAGRQIKDYWNDQRWNPVVKLGVLILGTLVLVFSSGLWVWAVAPLCLFYLIYRVLRAVVLWMQAPRAERPDPVPEKKKVAQAVRRRNWHDGSRALPLKTPREKMTELTGSMLLSALVSAVLSLLSVVFLLQNNYSVHANQYAWLAMVTLLGSWAVLIPAKIWEGREGETILRRFTMLVLGFGVGTAAWVLSTQWFVEMPNLWMDKVSANEPYFFDPSGAARLPAYLTYFGLMFLVLRWWLQADPQRGSRFSLITTIFSVIVASVLYAFSLPFPQPWGLLLVGNMSVAIQLASPVKDPDLEALD